MILPDIDSFYKLLGERIKTERIKKKISQKSIGDHLGLTRASIINLETGRHRPSIYQIIMIANYFNMDYTALIPFNIAKPQKKKKEISADLKNIITDQDKIDKSTRATINNFLSAINNNHV